MSVLVFGATGKCGREVVTQLHEKGVDTHAFVRDTQKVTKLLPSGVTLHTGDMSDADSVQAAMAASGARRVFLSTGNGPQQSAHECAAIRAAEKSGVEYVVKLSTVKAAVPLGPHLEIEEALFSSSLAATALRPAWFYQNLLAPSMAVGVGYDPARIVTDKKFPSFFADSPMSMIDTRDVGAVAAALLAQDDIAPHNGKCYDLTGPELLTMRGVAAGLSSVLGVSIECDPQDATEALGSLSMPPAAQKSLTTFFTTLGSDCRELSDEVQRISGRKPVTIADFLEGHRHVFGK
eukprot:CAMPEP_0196752236 /NCGR_PEP_ID=MMETSP1091-20130531/86468_1 /TAXON_ID=302021 /ORGANISM="Rhodomonas sp., Strain CCMP768" /LENGTH=291 /DNA_ID=CAMNT_0042100149 /DNA_START=90 /DNA_END=965 /DNA_ORIENTATION=+